MAWDDYYDCYMFVNKDVNGEPDGWAKELVENNPSWFHLIEDKEPTALKNEDDRIHDFRFAEWASHSDWTFVWSKQKWYNEEDEQNITPLTTQELFKKFKQGSLSQSIPAGKGTANETINEGISRGEWYKKWFMQPTDNPVLDRNKKERWDVAALIKFETMKDGVQYLLGVSKEIPQDKYEAIKEAIEQVLNAPKQPERWDLMWSEGKVVLMKSPTGKWLLREYPDNNEEKK
jgi:hypothetical protein